MHRFRVWLGLVALLCSLELQAHPGADTALEYFSQQISEHPGQQLLYLQRGRIYTNEGQYPQALADLQQASRLGDPMLVGFDLGVLYYHMGELELAGRYFDEFLQRFPQHAPCLEYRAKLWRDRGDYAASIADFRRLFALPGMPSPSDYIAVARMLQASGPDGIEPALAMLDEGSARLGITPQLQTVAIELELLRQRRDLAITRLQTLEPMLGNGPNWKVDMAELLLQSGQSERGLQLLTIAMNQLDALRNTPARQQTRARIIRLRESYAH